MTPLEHALAYAARGWRVHPIPPGHKHPHGMPKWQDNATTDPDRIHTHWTKHPNHGICIVTGHETGIFAIDIDPDHDGDDSLKALEAQYGPLPDTIESLTGGGGRHLLYAWPPGHDIRNAASGVLGVGIDIRGTGGQIVVAPTIHPNTGIAYAWEITHDPLDGIALAQAPEWLIELLTAPQTANEPRQPPRPRLVGDPLPGDWWEAQTDWPTELTRRGWTLHSTHHDAANGYYELWTRPGKTINEGASASLYYRGSNVLKNFSGNAKPLDADQTYTLWGFEVAHTYDGDYPTAARTVRATMPRTSGHHTSSSSTTTPPNADTPEEDWTPPIPLGDTDDVPAFPTEALPEWLADYATSVAEEVQVAVDLPALMGLVALSVANAGRYKVQVTGNGWTEQLNLYIVVALPPSAGKSPVVNKMLGAIHTHELDNRRKVEERIEHIALKRRIIEKAMKRAEDKGDVGEAQRCHDELAACPLPVIPRYIADDATPEALAALMHEQGGRLALISTEGGPFDIMAGRYSDRANLDVYLKSWGGDQLRVDRINRPAIVIANPTLTVGLTVQPQVISALAAKDEFKGRGLTARMMYSVPTDFVGYRNLHTVPTTNPALRHEYDSRILDMIRPEVPPTPELITLSHAAQTNFMGWRQSLEDRRRPDGDLRPMAEWSTKLESSVARVAGLLALSDGHTVVDETTMNRAIAVGTYWLQHAKVVHDMWQVDPRIAAARTIVDWLSGRDEPDFSVRDLYAGLRRTFPTADDTREPLGLLTERGWIRPLFDGPLVLGRRGKDSPRYSVNPLSLWITTSHARHARNSLREQFCSLSSSFPFSTFTAPSAHGAHGAHEPPDHPEAQPPLSTTNSDNTDELDQGPF